MEDGKSGGVVKRGYFGGRSNQPGTLRHSRGERERMSVEISLCGLILTAGGNGEEGGCVLGDEL